MPPAKELLLTFVEGTVIEIIYRNDENGYTVLEIDHDGQLLACVGIIPLVQPGEYARFYGGYTTHGIYGEQFKVASMETRMPEGDESIKLFLSAGLIKGVGSVLAARIVEEFHDATFDIIENHPELLAQVKGVSKSLALRIQEQYLDLQSIKNVVIQLQKLGLSVRQAMACIDTYGESAPYIIQTNPYRLMDDISGIGFEKADQIAAALDLENYGELRAYHGIKHVLRLRMSEGHTCYPFDRAVQESARLLQIDEDTADHMVMRLLMDGQLTENIYNGVKAVALNYAYEAESKEAMALIRLARSTPARELDRNVVEERLSQFETLSEEQERAVLMALQRCVCVITGGPGTGKTTILNHIISILELNGISAVLAAPTGRAAKRMEKATGRPAKTIHRLLEYGYTPDEDMELSYCRFARDAENPIEADAVIIDETSMVDIFLFGSLMDAIAPGTRLILTGDFDQLPSVGPGNVLKDIVKSETIPIARLTEIYRTHGNIATNAHLINQGKRVDLFSAGDFVFVPAKTAEETLERTVRLYTQALESGVSLDECQIICPVKKGAIGVYAFNKVIRDQLNPRLAGKGELTRGDTVFREGDKVMQTSNNYSKEWYLKGTLYSATKGMGAFNGDIGIIEHIDPEEKTAEILFDGERLATYTVGELDQLEHSYAVTVHKSQGSEFHTVILPLFYGMSDFLTRNLLYTAVTRAKQKLIIVGRESTVNHMIQNRRISGRFTALKYELLKYDALMESMDSGSGDTLGLFE